MKDNFNEVTQPELIEVENNSIGQRAIQRSLVFKGKSVLRDTLIKGNPTAGTGHCRSCGCKGYISKHNNTHECQNCGHHYDRHN